MSTSIYVVYERRTDEGKWEHLDLYFPAIEDQEYNRYAWFSGVRNYAGIEPLEDTPRGYPEGYSYRADLGEYFTDVSDPLEDLICVSWYSIRELLEIDYDQVVENRRWDGKGNFDTGNQTAPVGQGVKMTLFEFVGGQRFLEALTELALLGVKRIVFGYSI